MALLCWTMPNRRTPELVVLRVHPDAVVELRCTCNRRKRDQRGACEAQRRVLMAYEDVDTVGRTLLSHGTTGRG